MQKKILLIILFASRLVENYGFEITKIDINSTTDFSRQECGMRNLNGITFQNNIEGEAKFGEFPWMVAILKVNITDFFVTDIYQCGGTIISSKMVLTAAHCVNKIEAKFLKIRAGEWDIQNTDEPFSFTEHYVSNITIHDDFNNINLRNDIAILKLKDNITFAQHINKICLPEASINESDGKRCFVSGWGKDVFGKGGMFQTTLKKIEVQTVNFIECQNILRKKRMGKRFILHDSFMCAGGSDGIDACTGDGGSPLVCHIGNSTDHYYQVGIVAWGIKCGDLGVPGVYVNVAEFRSWINSKLALDF